MKNTRFGFLAFCLALTAIWPADAEDFAPVLAVSSKSGVRETASNVLLDLSGRLLNAVVANDTTEMSDVKDVIYGTPVTGKAWSQGRISAQLVPNADNALVDVFVNGQTIADTIGVPPGQSLLIYARSTTPFIARKRIYLNEAGANGFPAQARAHTSIELNRITDLQGRSDTFRTDIAELGFQVKKPLYEDYSNHKTETQLIKKLEDGFQPLLTQGNTAFANGLKQIKDQGIPLQEFHFSTTENLVSANARLALPGSNAPIDPPLAPPAPFDVAVRAHQSALNDTFQALLAGKTFTADELEVLTGNKTASFQAQLGLQFVGMVSEEGVLKRVSLTFADKEPIVTAFADHGVSLTVNIKEFRVAGLRLPGLKVRAIYKFENAPGRVEAVRQGDVQILPFYQHKIGGRILGAVLQGRLNQTFKERLKVPNIPVPAEMSQLGALAANRADAGNGWVVLTWLRVPAAQGK